jgi:hypothetical protein
MRILLSLLSVGCAWAQISQPKLGAMLSRDGSARDVLGVTGSVTLGDPVTTGVLSMGCSRTTCLLKTDSTIVSATGSVDAPPGPAIFSFDAGGALAFFPETRQLARWQNDSLTPVDFDVSGEIIAIGDGLFAVRRATGVWIVRDGDRAVQSLSHETRAALLFDGGILFATSRALILRRPNASEQSFAVEGVESLSWLGESYVQVRTHRLSYALRIDAGHERMSLLPDPEPQP